MRVILQQQGLEEQRNRDNVDTGIEGVVACSEAANAGGGGGSSRRVETRRREQTRCTRYPPSFLLCCVLIQTTNSWIHSKISRKKKTKEKKRFFSRGSKIWNMDSRNTMSLTEGRLWAGGVVFVPSQRNGALRRPTEARDWSCNLRAEGGT